MNKAYQIADNNLRACFRDGGIIASIDNFSDFWARDSLYASWGLLETKEFEKTKSNLALFIKYQTDSGQIPKRIDRYFVALEYLGIKIKRRALRGKYKGILAGPALDPNPLFIITCYRYAKEARDVAFLKENYNAIYNSMRWLQKHEKEFLHEELFANWADIIIKTGAVLYTNVLYAQALKNFSEICILLNKKDVAKTYEQKHESLKNSINDTFWNGNYYVDWINGDKKYNYFSTSGNVLAMLFGISDQDQNKKIINYIKKAKLDSIPMKTNYPSYPWWRVTLRMYIVGTPGYQNNFASWLWLGCVYAVSLYKNGYKKEAENIYRSISSIIEDRGMVFEVYAPDGSPYRGWFWQSATSFAWSAGLYIWMDTILPPHS